MAEVLFYHLTESTLEDALPPLLEKSLERGWRAVVQTGERGAARRAGRASVDLSRRRLPAARLTDAARHADAPAGAPDHRRTPIPTARASASSSTARPPPTSTAMSGWSSCSTATTSSSSTARARPWKAAEGRRPRRHLLAADGRPKVGAQSLIRPARLPVAGGALPRRKPVRLPAAPGLFRAIGGTPHCVGALFPLTT